MVLVGIYIKKQKTKGAKVLQNIFKIYEVNFMKTNWKVWIKAALIRAIKTVAQSAVSLIGVGAVMSDIDWVMVGSASVLAGILSILTSIAGLPEVKE